MKSSLLFAAALSCAVEKEAEGEALNIGRVGSIDQNFGKDAMNVDVNIGVVDSIGEKVKPKRRGRSNEPRASSVGGLAIGRVGFLDPNALKNADASVGSVDHVGRLLEDTPVDGENLSIGSILDQLDLQFLEDLLATPAPKEANIRATTQKIKNESKRDFEFLETKEGRRLPRPLREGVQMPQLLNEERPELFHGGRVQMPQLLDGDLHVPELFEGGLHVPRPELFEGGLHVPRPELFEGGLHVPRPELFEGGLHVPRPELFEGGLHVPRPELFEGGLHVPRPELFEGGLQVPRPELFEGGLQVPRPELFEGGLQVPRPELFEGGLQVPRPELFEGGLHVPRPELLEDRPALFNAAVRKPVLTGEGESRVRREQRVPRAETPKPVTPTPSISAPMYHPFGMYGMPQVPAYPMPMFAMPPIPTFPVPMYAMPGVPQFSDPDRRIGIEMMSVKPARAERKHSEF